jgi:hypothetical protein
MALGRNGFPKRDSYSGGGSFVSVPSDEGARARSVRR